MAVIFYVCLLVLFHQSIEAKPQPCCGWDQYEGNAIMKAARPGGPKSAYITPEYSIWLGFFMDFKNEKFAVYDAHSYVGPQEKMETYGLIVDYQTGCSYWMNYDKQWCIVGSAEYEIEFREARCIPTTSQFIQETKIGVARNTIDVNLWSWDRASHGWWGNAGITMVQKDNCMPVWKYDQFRYEDYLYVTQDINFIGIKQGPPNPNAFIPPKFCSNATDMYADGVLEDIRSNMGMLGKMFLKDKRFD